MRRIEFETSLGRVKGTITETSKVFDEIGEKFIVDIDESCVDNLDHYSWKCVFIFNYEYCKIELVDNSYGYPEYKYKKLKDEYHEYALEKESYEAWVDYNVDVKEYKDNKITNQ